MTPGAMAETDQARAAAATVLDELTKRARAASADGLSDLEVWIVLLLATMDSGVNRERLVIAMAEAIMRLTGIGQAADNPAAGPPPATLDGAPGVVGRALLYADGSVGRIVDEQVDAWRRAHPEAGRCPQPWREVLLVSPSAGRVLEAALEQRHADVIKPDLVGYQTATRRLAAAVDALERLHSGGPA